MRIKDNYKVRQIAGENLIVEQGKSQADMTKVISTKVISLNATALLLWGSLSGKDFTIADGAAVLVDHYGIPQEQAENDVRRWTDTLIRCGIISE